jgi:putative membrane protein
MLRISTDSCGHYFFSKSSPFKKTKIMSNISKSLLVLTVFTAAAISCGNPRKDSKEQADDRNKDTFKKTALAADSKFVTEAADAGMLEVKLGELATSNASLDKVKSLGKMMVSDHSMANDELQKLAQRKNISLPAALSDKSQKVLTDLNAKRGKEFDRAYSKQMVKDHKKVLDDFKKEAEKGDDADIKAWAAGKISTLEHHLDMSQQTEKSVDARH